MPEGRNGQLLSAAALGDIFSVEKLLNEGTDINARASNGTTALMGAAYAGYPRTTEYLILRGAQIDAQSTDGLTALHYAAGAGYTEIVGKLLDAGADPNAKSADGTTPLDASGPRRTRGNGKAPACRRRHRRPDLKAAGGPPKFKEHRRARCSPQDLSTTRARPGPQLRRLVPIRRIIAHYSATLSGACYEPSEGGRYLDGILGTITEGR